MAAYRSATALVIALLGATGCGDPAPVRQPGPTPVILKLEGGSPTLVAQSVLESLRQRQYESAASFLTSTASVEQGERFEKQAERWLTQGQNSWELKYRTVGVVELQGEEQAVVAIESLAPDKPGPLWHWHLRKEEKLWKVVRFEGGFSWKSEPGLPTGP